MREKEELFPAGYISSLLKCWLHVFEGSPSSAIEIWFFPTWQRIVLPKAFLLLGSSTLFGDHLLLCGRQYFLQQSLNVLWTTKVLTKIYCTNPVQYFFLGESLSQKLLRGSVQKKKVRVSTGILELRHGDFNSNYSWSCNCASGYVN